MSTKIFSLYLLISTLVWQPIRSIDLNNAKNAVFDFVKANRTTLIISISILASAGIIAWLYNWHHKKTVFNEQILTDLLEQLKQNPGTVARYDIINNRLDLSNLNIDIIPENFFTQLAIILPKLYWLDLSSNQIQTIPHTISQLKHLQRLEINHNQLKTIPEDSICQLTHLRILSLNNNNIKTIPDMLATNLHNLQRLHLGNNYIKSIPNSLGLLENLQEIALFNNKIHTVPESIVCQLPNLQYLFLSGNQIRERNFLIIHLLKNRQGEVEW